ncbi:MAG: orotate phosphoribosyltransferase [Legionellales bacterium]|nr:orotate phosphoribosyltransferase [Legionellales bacterium]
MVKTIKKKFIRLALESQVLQFGSFTLKSGRQSPYFFNAGLFYDGEALRQLGQCYAQLLLEQKVNCQHLFGPAYKGFTLVTATAIALAEQGIATKVTFNRKEAKDHGEGGDLIGAPLSGKIVVIDDVITAGTAFRQAAQLITRHHAQISTLVVALDRCEKGQGDVSAIAEVKARGIEVLSIITLYDLIEYLEEEQSVTQARVLREYASTC